MDRSRIPEQTIERLPRYMRAVREMQERGVSQVNSRDIAEACGTNSAQVRKDFSYIGELGTRGVGYDARMLLGSLATLIGTIDRRRVALVGYGRLGAAILAYGGFISRGFTFVAVFDSDPAKIGTLAEDLVVSDAARLEAILHDTGAEIAIVAVPPEAARDVIDRVVGAGIRSILNMTPEHVTAPSGVSIRHTCLCTELQILSFYLAREEAATLG